MISIVVMDNDATSRGVITAMLNTAGDMSATDSSDGHRGIRLVRQAEPDLVFLSARSPNIGWLRTLRGIRALRCAPAVGLFGIANIHVPPAISLGATGFIRTRTSAHTMRCYARTLVTGGTVFSPGICPHLFSRTATPHREQNLTTGLSSREQQALRLLASGATNTEIAAVLYVSLGTVKEIVSTIFQTLGVSSRVQAAVVAERAGLLAQDDAQMAAHGVSTAEPAPRSTKADAPRR